MGSELDIVNSARVSFEKETDYLYDKDIRLLEFLIEHKHDSCLRHNVMTFEVYAPLMVARQWYKHAVSSTHLDDQLGWNESSRRYITEMEQFYVPRPSEWRKSPENKKQGSAEPFEEYYGAKYHQQLNSLLVKAHRLYRDALAEGVAPEQARLFLPAYSMYVRWRWTASLNAVLHFLALRKEGGAQYEIREYADAINAIVSNLYPNATNFWTKHRI
jgi:thymidylate synthase (FAD)